MLTKACVISALLLNAAAVTVVAVGNREFKILPIGDSITEEHAVQAGCYRIYLERMFQENDVAYDMIGSKTGWLKGRGPEDLDMDYEAYSGQKTGFVLPRALATARANKCDVALIHLGTNDCWMDKKPGIENALTGIKELFAGLRETNPKIKVFVAMIPAACREAPFMEELNERLKTWAEEEDGLFHVEMRPVPGGFLRDKLHASAGGAKHMAQKWYEALDEHVFSAKPEVFDVPLSTDRELRSWTARSGSQLSARLLKTALRGSTAILETEEGKRLRISTPKLSAEDQAYIKEQMK